MMRTPIEGSNSEQNQTTTRRVGPTLRVKASGGFPGAPSRYLTEKFAAVPADTTNKGAGNNLTIVKPVQTADNTKDETGVEKHGDLSSSIASSRKFLFGKNAEEELEQKGASMISCQEYIQTNPTLIKNGPKIFVDFCRAEQFVYLAARN